MQVDLLREKLFPFNARKTITFCVDSTHHLPFGAYFAFGHLHSSLRANVILKSLSRIPTLSLDAAALLNASPGAFLLAFFDPLSSHS